MGEDNGDNEEVLPTIGSIVFWAIGDQIVSGTVVSLPRIKTIQHYGVVGLKDYYGVGREVVELFRKDQLFSKSSDVPIGLGLKKE